MSSSEVGAAPTAAEEVPSAQKRLVTAQDAERKRLERNIHDGVQQQLVALAVKLKLAEQLTQRDPEKAEVQSAHGLGTTILGRIPVAVGVPK